MGDTLKPLGGRAWRENVTGERGKIVVSLKATATPKNLDQALSILKSVQQLTQRYEDPEDKSSFLHHGSYLDPELTTDAKTVAQKSLEQVYDWLASTLEDSRLERHFRYAKDLTYSSSQFVALNTLDAAGFLKRHFRDGGVISANVWRDKIAEIERARPYIRSLLEESSAQPTDRDKVTNIVVLGLLALPIAAAAVVTIPELIAAFEAASLSAVFAVPGGSTAIAFVVEHYVLSEVIAYFAVGTIVNVLDAGGIEGFAEQLKTPEGAVRTAGDIIFFVAQVRAGRGSSQNTCVRIRGRVVQRTPQGVKIRVESVKEVHPAPAAPARLGKLNLAEMRNRFPGRNFAVRSTGAAPEALTKQCAPSVAGARQKYGERRDCNGHQEHHVANLPKNLRPEPLPSSIGGAHEIVVVTYEGKRYIIDSSAKQFVRDPAHPGGALVDIQKIRALDAKKPGLRLEDALNSGVFSKEQHDEFATLCGSLP